MSDGIDLFAQITDAEPTAVPEQVSTEPEQTPEADPSLADQQVAEASAPESEPTETEAAPVAEPVVAQTPPPAPNWDDPEQNPHFQAAQQLRQLQAHAAELARQRQSQEFTSELKELADDDPERLQRLQGMLARVATPLTQQSQQFFERANASEKALAAGYIAMKNTLPEEQFKELMAEWEDAMTVEGAENMERKLQGKREFQQTQQALVRAKDEQIAELQRQLAARTELGARQASGADLVDGGGGSVLSDRDPSQAQREATTMDDYFAAWPGQRVA